MMKGNDIQASSPVAQVVVLIEGQELIRRGLREIIVESMADQGGVEIIEAASFAEADAIVLGRRDEIALVVLDLVLPDVSVTHLEQQLETAWGDLPVVVLAASVDSALVARFRKAGALGFILKSSCCKDVKNAFLAILSGENYFPREIFLADADEPAEPNDLTSSSKRGPANFSMPARPVRLSPRQEEVLHFIFKGCTNKEIAKALNITVGTVKIHVAAIRRIFNVNSRSKAVMAAISSGFNEHHQTGVEAEMES